jgi:sulfide:quinone oxidoreductase
VPGLGNDYDIAATPGLAEAGHEFYTNEGGFSARAALDEFAGGDVIVGVLGTPYKCPPAPSETALLLNDELVRRGLRERSTISLVIDFPRPIPPSPEASQVLLTAFEERAIAWHPKREVCELDGARNVAILRDGGELPFDLFLGVPVHVCPPVVVASGMTENGWIPVDPLTLETRFPGVYAIGDIAAVGTPRAGTFAEGHAAIVAERLGDLIRGDTPSAEYNGHGICYLEMGRGQLAKVDITFFGEVRRGLLVGPSEEYLADKAEFGATRVRRWFGREWIPVEP